MSSFKAIIPGFPANQFIDIVAIRQSDGTYVLSLNDPSTGEYPSLASALTAGTGIVQQSREAGPVKLATITADLSLSTKQTIFTVPTGKSCIVHSIIMRSANVSLATASISYGFNAAAADVVANDTHTGLTGPTLYKVLSPIAAAAAIGAAASVFGVIANTQQAGATVVIDLVGYLF